MSTRIGVIAEDESDVDVLRALIPKIRPRAKHSVRRFLGHGCGKLRAKCRAWADDLARDCRLLIVLHDLDDQDVDKLELTLRHALGRSPISRHVIVIPVREIEAWLLSDECAITTAMGIKKSIPRVSSPENEVDPKRKIEDLVYRYSGKAKRYLHTIDNRKIAEKLDIARVRRCRSFAPLEGFLLGNL